MSERPHPARAWLVLALGLCGCEDEPEPMPPPPGPATLVQLEAWSRVSDVGADVFGAERPPGEVCDPVLGITPEPLGSDLVLEINTDLCNYATVQQPSLEPIAAGETVSIEVWHWELTAPDPAEAHLALAIEGEVVWEQLLPVPAEPSLVEATLTLDHDVPAGADLQFHVHNHGANSYDLVALEVIRGDEAQARVGPAPSDDERRGRG